MKKLLLLLLTFGSTFLVSDGQNTCGTATTLSGCINDSLPADSMKWYGFTATSKIVSIQTILSSSSVGHVHTIALYANCSGSPIKQVSITSNTQDTLILTDSSLSIGNAYYAEVSDNIPGCIRCGTGTASYQICRIDGMNTPVCLTWSFSPISGILPPYETGGCCCPSSPPSANTCYDPDDATAGHKCSIVICQNEPVSFAAPGISSPAYLTIYDASSPSTPIYCSTSSNTYSFTATGGFWAEYSQGPPTYGVLSTIVDVTVEPVPTPSFTLNSKTNPVCPGDEITLTKTDPSLSNQEWAWTSSAATINFPYISPAFSTSEPPFSFPACENMIPGQSNVLGLYESNGGQVEYFVKYVGLQVTGCAAAAYDTVNVSNLTPTFAYTYPCNGGPVQFTNTSTCPDPSNPIYNWSWDFGDAQTYSGPNPPPHTYIPGTYTVTLTASINDPAPNCTSCTATYAVPVTIYPPLTISLSGPDLVCFGSEPFTFCAAVNGGSGNYSSGTWSVKNGTFSSSTSCPGGISVVFPNSAIGGIVYYTVTDNKTGCTITDSAIVRGCCAERKFPPHYILADQSLSKLHGIPPFANATYSAGAWTFSNYNSTNPLFIDGVLVVDQNMTIKNSVVELGTLAQIQVEPGNTLTIQNCYLHACADMWDGIYVQAGGSLTIYGGSLIEDANNAVVSVDGGSYLVDDVIFNKDYKGIVVQPYNGAHTGTVYNTTFSCNKSTWSPTTLGAATTLIAPLTSLRTSEGMEIQNVKSISVGSAGPSRTNTFQNLDYGINSYSSSVTILNNDFNNAPYVAGVTGIYVRGDATGTKNANIGVGYANTFENWATGIIVRDTCRATVVNNTMNNVSVGISALNNFHGAQTFNGNTFIKVGQEGISAYNNLNSKVFMENNTIMGATTFVPVTGIMINEIISSTGTHYMVDNNTINKVANGIYANDVYAAFIKLNHVALVNTGFPGFNEGVYTGGSYHDQILNNTIMSLGAGITDGIYVNGGAGANEVFCNQTIHTENGCAFSGPTVSTQFIQNQMTGNTNGLLLYPSAAIGNQGATGNPNDNQWNGCVYSTNAFAPITNFFVQSPPIYDPTNNINGGVHFITTTGVSCYNCASGISCESAGLSISTASQVINNSTLFTTYPSTSHWLEKHSLYRYLTGTDSSLLSDVGVKHFRDSAKAANMGMLEGINTALADSNGLSNSDIKAATGFISSITSPDTAEQTAQVVQGIVIAMQGSGSNLPNAAQISSLQTIAPLCPAQYGDAVFIARALLSQVDTAIYVSSCENSVSKAHHTPTKQSNTSGPDVAINAKVYPNPANTILNVQTQLARGQIQNICIYNSLGQQVRCIQLTDNLTTIPISNLSQGLYFYRIIDMNDNLVKADKVIIIH